MQKSVEPSAHLFGGISGATLCSDSFDLGKGVSICQTYAHITAPHLMMFARPASSGIHPGPWKAAKGGFSFDIEVELRVPHESPIGDTFDAKETIWWIAALLRLAKYPFIHVPVTSNHAFSSIPALKIEPELEPFEIQRRIFSAPDENTVIEPESLYWIRERWLPAGKILQENSEFRNAVKAFDAATVVGRNSASLLSLWGSIEQIFSPSAGELRFRVSSLLASYLEPPGPKRLARYKEILELYDGRSLAAHTAREAKLTHLMGSYVLARNALVRMIDEVKVPSQADLQELLFGLTEANWPVSQPGIGKDEHNSGANKGPSGALSQGRK